MSQSTSPCVTARKQTKPQSTSYRNALCGRARKTTTGQEEPPQRPSSGVQPRTTVKFVKATRLLVWYSHWTLRRRRKKKKNWLYWTISMLLSVETGRHMLSKCRPLNRIRPDFYKVLNWTSEVTMNLFFQLDHSDNPETSGDCQEWHCANGWRFVE